MLYNRSHDSFKHHQMTPVSLIGTLVPDRAIFGSRGEYRLITEDGTEYGIITHESWSEDAAEYRWKKIRVIGLLDGATAEVLPNRIILLSDDEEPGVFSEFLTSPLTAIRNFVSGTGTQGLAT